ncbi:exodeoxyribonuclease 7 large subunit [Sphingobacterium mizutaii NBRC 14946 = DSM 11724]|uniref:Exodeoxyribonuclease 7 large subunit n=2 Tax=Sphingobacterium mizutaii TaxID=1010 RepID=A0AAJ5BYM8_9SPHI|nr:exodeoxyribonuclease VII large subunit [Sphingobacterium mizutaii]GEM68771.1 exodeoxyribonuclease 7 large subunit [Sphingobacterium mizutaii NBRC 14946 = DSM 11724]SDL84767.1 Exodeoxyribonuclease VII large subunit [Sphingobacterium mizutaii]SNV36551.1 Exodeoxyribonuclease 7 large subunit [Sphingobacterium mizutaii]
MPELMDNKTVFTLLEVSRSIQKTIAERYKSLYWIKAEMNKLNHYSHSGHCYPELLEKKEGKVVAEMRSILWKMDYQRINRQFLEVLGEPLREGITMLFQAGISYDPLYGFSLKIVDIDPTFVLGELEKEKRESIKKLTEEGVFDANKRLPFPLIPKRLAIISVETSKGLSDFFKIINGNPWGYKIECTLFPALLQGDKSISSIIKQLEVIANKLEDFDAVAIIRGGGGDVGLSSYNNYFLSKAIAIFPIPVLTGIGHSTNETVSEMVAYKNAITPSELADFLLQKFHNFAIPVDNALERMLRAVRRNFEEENLKLKHIVSSISWNSKTLLLKDKSELNGLQTHLIRFSRQNIKENQAQLQHLERMLGIVNPIHILKRGFSIVRIDGKSVHKLDQVEIGAELEIQLEDGKVISKVINKESKHGK